MRAYVSCGELRAEHLALFEDQAPAIDLMLAAPGLLERPPAAHAEVARAPGLPLSVAKGHGFLSALLDAFSVDLDRLPQTAAWERRIARWIDTIDRGGARFWFRRDQPAHTRLVCLAGASVVTASPLVADLWASADPDGDLRLEVTGAEHDRIRAWFERVRDRAQDVTPQVRAALAACWAGDFADPEDVYYRVVASYFRATLDGLDAEADDNPMRAVLTEFQDDAYQHAKSILRRYGGVVLADVVGLGKTYIAVALLSYLQRSTGSHALVLAPPAICRAWDDLAAEHRIELVTLSTGKLEDLDRYADREVVVIDESHNFRNMDTRRYERISAWLRPHGDAAERRVLLLSATPQNTRPSDLLAQLHMFPDVYSPLPHRGESLQAFFREVEQGRADATSLLQHVVVRRTRSFIRTAYPEAKVRLRQDDGQLAWVPLRFPRRLCGEEQALRYRIDEAYAGDLYARLLRTLAQMRYPLHGLGFYVLETARDDRRLRNLSRSGKGLRGLYKVLLLKRLESSVHAFRLTAGRLRDRLEQGLRQLSDGVVRIRVGRGGTDDDDTDDTLLDDGPIDVPAALFERRALRRDLIYDRGLITDLLESIADLTPDRDSKLQRLRAWFVARPPQRHRTVVFTQFADTARWLFDQLGAEYGRARVVTGGTSGTLGIIRRFAPRGNHAVTEPADQIDLLISTDTLSEGVNLQDADTLINYDIHWNPVRLIQRAGRIDRIGSPNDEIQIASFLPETKLEAALGLEAVVRSRIADFTSVFGEDGAFLPAGEQLDEGDVVSAYAGRALADADEGDAMDGLSRHAQRVLHLRRRRPDRFDHIMALRPGVRALSAGGGVPDVAATRLGWYWRFWGRPIVTGALEPVDDVDGMELLWRHAQAGAPTSPADALVRERVRSMAAEGMRNFEPDALAFRARKERPRLEPIEEWVRERLDAYSARCVQTRRPLIDQMIAWVLAGQHKPVLVGRGRQWRKEQLSGEAVFQGMKSLLRQLPLLHEELGDPELVAVSVGVSGAPDPARD